MAIKEGIEAWTGKGCACTADPLAGLSVDDRQDACCSSNEHVHASRRSPREE